MAVAGPDLDGSNKAGCARRTFSLSAVCSVLTSVLLFSQIERSDSSIFLGLKTTHRPNGDVVQDGTPSDIRRNEGT